MAISTITSNSIADGAVTSSDLATGAVEQAMTTQIGGRRNLIINGAMQVAQRSTSEETDVGYKTVDRFRTSGSNGGGLRQQQIALTSSDTPFASGFRNSYRMKVVTADTGASGRFASIIYFVEAQDLANSGWDYTSTSSNLTISFWAKSSVAGTYYARFITQDGTLYAYGHPYTLTANTWTYVTFTVTGNANITVDNNNDKGMTIEWVLEYGTAYTDSSFVDDTWTAYNGSIRTDDFAQSWRGTTDATFEITGVQLEVGSVATPFEHRSYGEELALCQRYFYTCSRSGYLVGRGNGSANLANVNMPTPVLMRTTPSISDNSGAWYAIDSDSYVNGTGATFNTITLSATHLDVQIGNLTNMTDNRFGMVFLISGYSLDAEL